MRSLICLLGLLFCFAGCDAPMAKSPIGKPWKSSEVTKLDGTWCFKDQGITFALVGQKDGHAQGGVMNVDRLNDPSKNSIKLIRMDCVFTKVGKYEMVFFKAIDLDAKDKEEGAPNDYLFWLITKRDADSMAVSAPTDQFHKLVESMKLPGKIIEGKRNEYVVIDTDEKTLLDTLESVGIDKLFDHKMLGSAERVQPKKK